MRILLVAGDSQMSSAQAIRQAMQEAWSIEDVYAVIAENTEEAVEVLRKWDWMADAIFDLRIEPAAEVAKLCDTVNVRWRPIYVHLEVLGSEVFRLHHLLMHAESVMSRHLLVSEFPPEWEKALALKVGGWLVAEKIEAWLKQPDLSTMGIGHFCRYVQENWQYLGESTKRILWEALVIKEGSNGEIKVSLM